MATLTHYYTISLIFVSPDYSGMMASYAYGKNTMNKQIKDFVKYLIIAIISVNVIGGAGALAFHYFGNNFLLLALLSSPFLIIFGMLIINASVKNKIIKEK